MRRRALFQFGLAATAAALAAGCWGTRRPNRAARIAILGTVWIEAPEGAAVIRARLSELGWVEGQNLIVDWHYVTGNEPWLPDMLAVLVNEVDVVVVPNEPTARAVLRASASLPIVLGAHPDPVATGLVASLDKPGGTITGNGGSPVGVIFHKRLELLMEVAPALSRVAVLHNPQASPATYAVQIPAVSAAAQRLGVALHLAAAYSAAELPQTLEAAAQAGADGLFLVQDPINVGQRDLIVGYAAQRHWPAMYPGSVWVDDGGLMSFGASAEQGNRRIAEFVDRILRGAKPADLPIQQPDRFDLTINSASAATLGLSIPPAVAAQATRWV